MKFHMVALAILPALALGACGGTDNARTDNNLSTLESPRPLDQDNVLAEVIPASPAQAFVNTVAASDYYEIEAGKLAQEKATTQALKNFGGMMVTGHTATTNTLKSIGAAASPAWVPSAVLTAQQEADLASLRAANGADFDTAYKAQQVAAHEKAHALLQDYAANGDGAELKKFASDTAKTVKMHLDRIKGM